MKLYYRPGACSMASHMVLCESGLEFTTEEVDFANPQKEKSFLEINPKGYVPVLELDNGETLTEGTAILQYIADNVVEKNLIPRAGTWERYRCLEWLNYIATEIHKTFGSLWRDDCSDSEKIRIKEELSKKFDFLAKNLKGGKYLMGANYSVADAYLYTILNWSNVLKIDLKKWPALMGYMELVRSRPASVEALREEGLIR